VHYRLNIGTLEFKSRNQGQFIFVELAPHLRYTREWHHNGEVSEIDVRFTPNENGTQVSIKHTGFVTHVSTDKHAKGWNSYIAGLNTFLSE
jgi:hypothetical protein